MQNYKKYTEKAKKYVKIVILCVIVCGLSIFFDNFATSLFCNK